MPERDILEELANATEENPVIIDRPLNIPEQVEAFNINIFGYDVAQKMHEDFRYKITISDNMFKLIEKEKGKWWGNIESQTRYAMQNCIDLGYIPWKLTYSGFDEKGEDGGTHNFYISCEDRRINWRTEGHNCDGVNNDCNECCKRRGLGMP